MSGSLLKLSTIGLPARVIQTGRRPVRWQAGLYDEHLQAVLTAEGGSPQAACDALTDATATALVRMGQRPILVIGGGPDYPDCIHVINPEPAGCVVYAVRNGHRVSSWYSSDDRTTLLRRVLDQVGGAPHVVTL